jgi:hypothetical protein
MTVTLSSIQADENSGHRGEPWQRRVYLIHENCNLRVGKAAKFRNAAGPGHSPEVTLMKSLVDAIVEADVTSVAQYLERNPDAVQSRFSEARLFEEVPHWIYEGDTALHLAAAMHDTAIVNVLLARGADPNAAHNHRLGRPLHYAADGYPDSDSWLPEAQTTTLRALLDAGAEIDARDKNGASALHRAVRTRCAAAVKLLLDAGSDPQMPNKSGSSPFHLAVQNTGRGGAGSERAKEEQLRIIQCFLGLGTSIHLKDGSGKSVIDCARSDWIRTLLDENE